MLDLAMCALSKNQIQSKSAPAISIPLLGATNGLFAFSRKSFQNDMQLGLNVS